MPVFYQFNTNRPTYCCKRMSCIDNIDTNSLREYTNTTACEIKYSTQDIDATQRHYHCGRKR